MRVRSGDLNRTFTCKGRKSAKMTKECLRSSFQLLEWYKLNLGGFVKLPNLAKCPKPSWSFGQLQAAWRGGKKNPHRYGARKPVGARGDSGLR